MTQIHNALFTDEGKEQILDLLAENEDFRDFMCACVEITKENDRIFANILPYRELLSL